MDEQEFMKDFEDFKIYMQIENYDEAAQIVGDYIFILTTNPKRNDLPIYSNVKILLKSAPPELHSSFEFFKKVIRDLIHFCDEDRLVDFRWRLN